MLVLVADDTHVDTGSRSLELISGVTGAFERFPTGFQQEPLLGVDGMRFTGADAEEGGIERPDIADKPALVRIGLTFSIGVRVKEGRDVPTRGRYARDGIAVAGQQVPEILGTSYIAGKTAGHRNNRDLVAMAGNGHGRDGRLYRVAGAQLGGQPVGQDAGVGVVENKRGRQPDPGERGKAIPQLYGQK